MPRTKLLVGASLLLTVIITALYLVRNYHRVATVSSLGITLTNAWKPSLQGVPEPIRDFQKKSGMELKSVFVKEENIFLAILVRPLNIDENIPPYNILKPLSEYLNIKNCQTHTMIQITDAVVCITHINSNTEYALLIPNAKDRYFVLITTTKDKNIALDNVVGEFLRYLRIEQ